MNGPSSSAASKKKHMKMTLEAQKQVTEVLERGEHLVFVDECTFVSRAFQQEAWSNTNTSIVVKDRTGK